MKVSHDFIRRYTSRPFIAAVTELIKNAATAYIVLNPNVPQEKVNAIVALCMTASAVIIAYIKCELDKDADAIKAQAESTKLPETISAGGDVSVGSEATAEAVKPQTEKRNDGTLVLNFPSVNIPSDIPVEGPDTMPESQHQPQGYEPPLEPVVTPLEPSLGVALDDTNLLGRREDVPSNPLAQDISRPVVRDE